MRPFRFFGSRGARLIAASALALTTTQACSGDASVIGSSASDPAATLDESAQNPFLQDQSNGKLDSQYLNPDGIEVEVDLEADLDTAGLTRSRTLDAPAILGQFALTYLRKNQQVYLESLAEQASSEDRVEWQVDGQWLAAGNVSDIPVERLKRFRIRGINAVLLHTASRGIDVGSVITAPVPLRPYSVYADAGKACAEVGDGHMALDQSIYWYMWEPERSDCTVARQDMAITVSKMLPSKVTYPEYDQLVADGRVTMVVLFGQIGDGPIVDSDIGVRAQKQMASWLTSGGFSEITPAPVGRRFLKTVKGVDVEVDLYSPYDFSGLSDYKNYKNFEKALAEHEIVTYDGHSMLGASDFWSRPTYPDFYQIFLYGGCLGYEYYVAPILGGKGGWDNLDILSSVVEVSANANEYAGPFLAKLVHALENDYKVSWKDILVAIRSRVGDSTFGMSGVRENCFSPTGSMCGPEVDGDTQSTTWDQKSAVAIPDADPAGVASTIEVPESLTVESITITLDIEHSYIGDLVVSLTHGETTVVVYDGSGAEGSALQQSFTFDDFAGQNATGTWTLQVVDGAAQDDGQLVSWSLTATSR
ncbi:MAG: proprotein convertase P-domain-containing protein [Myxococcales bacterium]|nr:proprotein convertase P-domain-containing protein [Myxococcales bacterium]